MFRKQKNNSRYKFTDMHCHIIPGIDDGAQNIEASKRMVELAYNEGIRTILATPHYHPIRGKATENEIQKAYNKLRIYVESNYSDLHIYLGREVYYTSDIIEDIEKRSDLLINNTRYILTEYSTSVDYNYLMTSIDSLIVNGYIPIIAHVERYGCIQKNYRLVEELKSVGALIQVNADSIIGGSGNNIKKVCKSLVENYLVDIIGTDAHNCENRAPRLLKCADYLMKKYDEVYVQDILLENATKILQGKYLEEVN